MIAWMVMPIYIVECFVLLKSWCYLKKAQRPQVQPPLVLQALTHSSWQCCMVMILSRFQFSLCICVCVIVCICIFNKTSEQTGRCGAFHWVVADDATCGWWWFSSWSWQPNLLGHATGFMQRCWYSLPLLLLLLLVLLLHKTLPAPLLLLDSHLLEAWVKVVGWQGGVWRVGCILPAGSRHPHHRWRLFRAWQLHRGLCIETHNGLQIQIHRGLQLQTERGLQIHTQQQWTKKRVLRSWERQKRHW